MSSALKKWGQIDSRIKYFMAFGDVSGYTLQTGVLIADFITSTEDVIGTGGAWNPPTTIASTGNLLKDLGRMITVYDDGISGNPHTAIYRQVQVVNGIATGGVGGTRPNGYNSYWIKVWSADGMDMAKVARTG
jgi:hypothetical protein